MGAFFIRSGDKQPNQSCTKTVPQAAWEFDSIDSTVRHGSIRYWSLHVQISLSNSCERQIKARIHQASGLLLKVLSARDSKLGQLMQPAMVQYKIDRFEWGSKSILYWYEQCSFTDGSTSKCFAIHVGDYVELTGGRLATVKHIYTYCPPFDYTRHIFIYVQLLQKT